MDSENLLRSGSLIEKGFLSNRILEIVNEKKELSDSDLIILRDGQNLIKIIIQGKNQISSGKLGDDSLNAANAYSSTLSALISIDEELLHKIEEVIVKVQNQIKLVIDNRKVEKENIKELRLFFDALLQHTLNEISNDYYKNIEETEWMKPLF